MLSRGLTRIIAVGFAAVARGQRLRHPQRNRRQRLSRCRHHPKRGEAGIQRPVWTGIRGSIGHGSQRVDVELHNVDFSGAEADRR